MFDQRFDEFGPFGADRGGPTAGPFFGGVRMGRGSMEPAILGVLKEKPMHGYEIISTLEAKSHGMWRPSPGSVYPTLQLLEEKGMVKSHEESGKKVYEITADGEVAAEHERDDYERMWRERETAFHDHRDMHRELRTSMKIMRNIFHKGSEEQKKQLLEAIDQFIHVLKNIEKGGRR
jgi:DNA-binding PadR family transcriptional regulator